MTIEVDIIALLKFIGGVIVVAVLVFILYKVYRETVIFFRSREYRLDKKGIKRKWNEIEKMIRTPGEMNHKLAVLEADKILDYVLKSMAMPGKDLGERLRFACFKYNKLRRVWWAHKVRNQLVHESTFHLDYGLAKKAVKEFKRALEEIGAF